MDTIRLNGVLPHVFLHRKTELQSAVWNQQIQFGKGECYLVEAASGQGKSSLCSFILGYRHDYDGKIEFCHSGGKDVDAKLLTANQWADIRKQHISCLFQDLRLFPELTALENVEIKNRLTGFKSRKFIMDCFELLDIADKTDAKVGQMSFGQQQRVALIRALVQPFDFILADEPISHLDDQNAEAMGHLLVDEARQQGAGIIVTSIGKHLNLKYDKVLKL